MQAEEPENIAELDRRLVLASQAGLPLHSQPYQQLAIELGVSTELLMARFKAMLQDGRIRRIGVVPNHYRLGYNANAMTVWDVKDSEIKQVGEDISRLDMVTHCYQRPRYLPNWPYNLFAMVHGQRREAVLEKVEIITKLIGSRSYAHDVLFSTRILKKTGLRLVHQPGE